VTVLYYLVLGTFAGLMAGLLGVGGGLVIVPVLSILFSDQGFAAQHVMHLAVATSLATIVLTSLSSAYAHHRRGAVHWPAFGRLSVGIVGGSGLAALLSGLLPGAALKSLFGAFELLVAAQMAFGRTPRPHRTLPGPFALVAAGAVIGALSALLGIGGGTLTVPFLLWCNLPMRQAVATSAACGLPIAAAGTLGFVASGWAISGLPRGTVGYVYLPAVAGIAAASILSAPAGAWMTHHLSGPALKRSFAAFLALLGLKMMAS
jgi:uncharacterized membrane protein YfcA